MKATLYALAGVLAALSLILFANSRSAMHETVVALVFVAATISLVGGAITGWLERIFDSLESSRISGSSPARSTQPLSQSTSWQSEEERVRHWEAAEQRLRSNPAAPVSAEADSILAQSQASAQALRDLRR